MCNQPSNDNAIAFCKSKRHKGKLSHAMIQQHDCINKNCKFFVKNENHSYWIQKENKNKNKKKYKKKYSQLQGVKEKPTSTYIRRNKSSLNTNNMKSFIQNIDYFHDKYYTYLFNKNDIDKMRYIGGFFNLNDALQKSKEENGNFIVISKNTDEYIGYRIDSDSNAIIEIDLTWGYLYPELYNKVHKDIDLKIKYNALDK